LLDKILFEKVNNANEFGDFLSSLTKNSWDAAVAKDLNSFSINRKKLIYENSRYYCVRNICIILRDIIKIQK
jgi:hypothetical protein